MAKRPTLTYDSATLAKNLKQSTGQGVDALFSPPSPPRPEQAARSGATKAPKSPRRRPETPRKRAVKAETVGRHLSPKRPAPTAPEKPATNTSTVSRHHDTTKPRHREPVTATLVETVRKAVKQIGREVATSCGTVAGILTWMPSSPCDAWRPMALAMTAPQSPPCAP
jgi:hypothetical protein